MNGEGLRPRSANVCLHCAFRVTVDLSTDSDLVFHFNPRFNESGRKVIVRNSKIGGRWGREERDLSRFPFTAGQPFEVNTRTPAN